LPLSPICYNTDDAATIQETTMDIGVKFPSDTEVILEDVESFRALTPDERLQYFRGMVNVGEQMLRNSPKSEWLKEYSEEQERLAQRNIREFIARHGY
jgi:hypothetical protein